MNKLFTFLLLACIFLSTACQNKEAQLIPMREDNSFLSKKISFSAIQGRNNDAVTSILNNKKSKVIIYLDSAFCTPCAMTDLTRWRFRTKELKELNTEIILICNHPSPEIVAIYMEDAEINYPVLFDKNEQFKKQNNLPKSQILQTFVIDATNTVIWLKSPIFSKELWESFCTMMTIRQITEKSRNTTDR